MTDDQKGCAFAAAFLFALLFAVMLAAFAVIKLTEWMLP